MSREVGIPTSTFGRREGRNEGRNGKEPRINIFSGYREKGGKEGGRGKGKNREKGRRKVKGI